MVRHGASWSIMVHHGVMAIQARLPTAAVAPGLYSPWYTKPPKRTSAHARVEHIVETQSRGPLHAHDRHIFSARDGDANDA